jgi:hydrogenase maturation protease
VNTAPADVLVIGYGNPLRGDDGIGPHVADLIAKRRWPGVRTLSVHQLTPELAAELANVRFAIFVDASAGDEGLTELEPGGAAGAMTHNGDPGPLLALTRSLYRGRPMAWLLTVRGLNFDHGDQLSREAAREVPRVMERIAELLRMVRPARSHPQ